MMTDTRNQQLPTDNVWQYTKTSNFPFSFRCFCFNAFAYVSGRATVAAAAATAVTTTKRFRTTFQRLFAQPKFVCCVLSRWVIRVAVRDKRQPSGFSSTQIFGVDVLVWNVSLEANDGWTCAVRMNDANRFGIDKTGKLEMIAGKGWSFADKRTKLFKSRSNFDDVNKLVSIFTFFFRFRLRSSWQEESQWKHWFYYSIE